MLAISLAFVRSGSGIPHTRVPRPENGVLGSACVHRKCAHRELIRGVQSENAGTIWEQLLPNTI